MKKILLITGFLWSAYMGAFAQCLTPTTGAVCAGSTIALTANPGSAGTFSNLANIDMPGGQPTTTTGNFGPSPSTIAVTGLPTTGITVATVTLNGMNHTFSGDLDIILVSPTGTVVVLLTDAGGAQDLSNTTLTFKDGSPAFPNTTATPIPSGTFSPTGLGSGTFTPGPGTVTQTSPSLSNFSGNMNGTWSLYGFDDAGGDYGAITGGWSITFAPTVTWSPAGSLYLNAAGTVPYVAGTSALAVYAGPAVATTYTATFSGGTCVGTATSTISINPASACYCASTATNIADEDIFNVTVGSLSNTSNCTSVVDGTNSQLKLYSNYTNGTTAVAAPSLVQGGTYPSSVSIGTCGGNFGNAIAVYADFNQNGNFLDAGEKVYGGASVSGAHTDNFNFVVPDGAVVGTTRMRVINVEGGTATSILSCGTYTYGETEDYNITITPCIPSTVTTAPPATTSVACGGTATIAATIGGTFPAYQWQVQTVANGVWLNLTNVAPYSTVNTNTLTITGVTPTMNGYNYRLIYSNACTGTSFTTASTLNVTAIAPTFTQAPAALCAGGTVAQLITVTGGGTGVFTPTAGLFTDAAHLIAYTGTAVTSVYAFPTAAGQYSATYTLIRTNGVCVSTPGTVTVVANAPIAGTATIPAATAICANAAGTIALTGITGGGLTYQWQISTLAVPAFTNLGNGGVYSGATTANLIITNPVAAMTGNQYRVVVTSASCGTNATSNATTLTVNPVPVVVIAAAPGTTVAPGQTNQVTLSATVSSATAPFTYQWFRNGGVIAGANASTYVVPANGAGFYSVVVTDANGCATGTSSPISITITAKPTDNLFIYPSPNSGSFQVRYYNATATATATEYAWVNIYDAKGTRVYTQRYALNGAYTRMNVVMNVHGKGIYRVDLVDNTGVRLQTGSVFIF